MDMPTYSSHNQCAVCQSVPHGSHFGVPACRSCASFFRRTVFERKVYKCKKSNFCDEFKGTFLEEFKPLKLADWVRMERGSASLLHTMCINYFEPFNILPYSKKMEILKEYWKYFQILYTANMSVVYFEKSGENYSQNAAGINKLVMHYGYYEDMETIRDFFPQEDCDPEKAPRYCEPLFKLLFDYLNEYCQLRITELEMIAMYAILFCNTVDKFEMLNPEMRRKRDSIYIELNSILMRSLGGISGSIRLDQLVSFIHKTTTQAAKFCEIWLCAKIDLPQFRDAWDEDDCPISADRNHTDEKERNSQMI